MVMDIYDEYIANIRKKYEWGYTMPYHIAANHVCHPNYAAYLINKQTLTMKDIEKIIQSIPDAYKVLYDRVLIDSSIRSIRAGKSTTALPFKRSPVGFAEKNSCFWRREKAFYQSTRKLWRLLAKRSRLLSPSIFWTQNTA